MLGATAGDAADRSSRLIVEPPGPVAESVLPDGDPERAAAESVAAGIPAELLRRFGATVRQTHRRARVVVVEVAPDRQEALAAALRAAGIPARPPLPVRPLLSDSVPAQRIPPVWAAGYRGTGIRVGIVDTGVDLAHPDFAGRLAAFVDFTGAGRIDDVGHGTHVAGIVAGSGAVYRGVAPEATLVVAKALAAAGGAEDTVLAALSWASRQRIAVLNLSLGGPGDPTSPLAREVDALAASGIIVCVAAGNGGPGPRTISAPANARGALTVGATDKHGGLTAYSSRGPVPGVRYRKPDLLAVGGGVTEGSCAYGSGVASARAGTLAADPCAVPPRYVRMSGTSMAAPHVAGICALLVEASGGQEPSIHGAERIRRALVRSARRIPRIGANDQGAGFVDAERALALIAAAQPAPA